MSALLESLLGERAAPAALAGVREAAIAALRERGLPGPRDEAWKYTSLRALEQRRYADGDCGARMRAIDVGFLPGPSAARLVFVNGIHREDLSEVGAVTGLDIERLGERPDELAAILRSAPPVDAFGELNAALALDGVRVRVAAGARIQAPVQIVHVGTPADGDVAWSLRVQVELGDGAQLRLIEHHVGSAPNANLGSIVAAYRLGARARLDLIQLQDGAEGAGLFRRSDAVLGSDAIFDLHTVEVGAQLARHDLVVALEGRGARLRSRGVFALRGRQHADTRLAVTHAARDTACDIAWRGVADQRSRGVFHGAITVAAGADGADAQLSNKNLLLSAQAEIDTQPVLEIHADEVKAAHGATVGQLDERALFYLRSRGLPLDLARRMLVAAFCGAVLDDLEPALRARVDALLAARLPQAEATP
ncbi:Fe-S cluster assembly protein SufD [Dokdonella fugitiva]|uniref:Fe-S cluster assembly protein SufD n=1 Tax=Dokdonella fugitiva TaxID=328517 RepID=A0A839FAQ6_9GAMM|nr:Fe-S cluster assembly protein SufD [Dokdonella fugitiva]MBA8889194.1 Fe-S cluster assembly protein SufD [Dokdonella fugitiva]